MTKIHKPSTSQPGYATCGVPIPSKGIGTQFCALCYPHGAQYQVDSQTPKISATSPPTSDTEASSQPSDLEAHLEQSHAEFEALMEKSRKQLGMYP